MLKGLGQLGDMAKIMKQAQEVQGKVQAVQDSLHDIIVSAESGGGLVRCTANARGELKSLDIDPSIFSKDDKEIAEDLILAAIKDVQERATKTAQAEMAKATEGFPLPDGMKFPGME